MNGTELLSVDEFAESVKAKYPQYKDVDNAVLAQKMIEKYPQYKDKVSFENVEGVSEQPTEVVTPEMEETGQRNQEQAAPIYANERAESPTESAPVETPETVATTEVEDTEVPTESQKELNTFFASMPEMKEMKGPDGELYFNTGKNIEKRVDETHSIDVISREEVDAIRETLEVPVEDPPMVPTWQKGVASPVIEDASSNWGQPQTSSLKRYGVSPKEIEEARLEDEKIKDDAARAAAVGREQGKIVASEIGSTDDAIMPNTDVAISEKISKGIEQQQDRVLDSGAKMMYGWKGEDNYYATLWLNYLDETSPNKANDLRSRMENDSGFFGKQRDGRTDFKSPSAEVVAQGFNIAMTVGHKNFEKAANKAESIIEEIESVSPKIQAHADRIKDGVYNGTEEQLSEYMALAKKADDLYNLPQMEAMQKAQSELERINNDYRNSADVNILDYYEEVKKNNQTTTDNAFRKNNAVLDVVIPVYDAGTKAIINTFKGVADLVNNVNTDNKWGSTDDVAAYFKTVADTYEHNNPTPSKFAREMFERVVVIDGYEVALKGGKPTGRVFAPNGYLATEEDSEKTLKEYSSNPEEYDTEESFNFRSGLYTATTVAADMVMGLIPIGGVVSKGAKLAGMSTKVAGAAGVSTAVIIQSQNDFYQAAKEAGATDQEAAALGFTQASVISLVALINPVEAKALMMVTGTARKRLISQYVKEFAAGIPRKAVIQKFGKAALAKALAKKGKAVGLEVIKEAGEETLEIPAGAMVANAWDYMGGVNTQTETDIYDVLNTAATAGLGALPFALLVGGGGSSRSRQELMYAATTDLSATRELLRKSIGKEITTESGEKIIINDDYINKHISQLEELKNISSAYFSNKNITEEDKIAVTSLISKKKSLEEASKIGGDPVKKKSKAEIEAIDAALELYLDKEKGKPFYIVQGVAVTKEQLEERMANPEWVKGFKAGRWNLKVSNDKDIENKLVAIYDSKDDTKETPKENVQEPITEKLDAQESTSDSEEVGEGDSRQEVPTREGETKGGTETSATDSNETIRPVAEKVAKGEELTTDEQVVYDNNSEVVDEAVDTINQAEELVESKFAPIRKQVEKARTAIKKILPDVEIVIHENASEFAKAVPAEDSEASGGAFYDGKIHINRDAANSRTVAHEVFHAVILKSFNVSNKKDAATVTRLTNNMLKSVERLSGAKSLNKVVGTTIDGKPATLKDYIKSFAGGYGDKSINSEEQLAELTGYLSDNLESLDVDTKTAVKAWLGKLAEALGINKILGSDIFNQEMTDKQAVDLLNTIAGKVAKGEEIKSAKELSDIYSAPKVKKAVSGLSGPDMSVLKGAAKKLGMTVEEFVTAALDKTSEAYDSASQRVKEIVDSIRKELTTTKKTTKPTTKKKSEPRKQNPTPQKIKATITFKNRSGKTFDVSREFNGMDHLNNYIDFKERKGLKEVGTVTDRKKAGPRLQKGAPLFSGKNNDIINIANDYITKKGLPKAEEIKITKLNTEYSKAIADVYDAAKHDPTNKDVLEAYKALAVESKEQFEALDKAGYKVELWDGTTEPYSGSEAMLEDLKKNKHLYVYSTEQGFGESEITAKNRAENPMLADSGYKDAKGNRLLLNDLFRFVHDVFGHGELGNSFGPIGEENAWNVHSQMFSPKARRAMTSETRGQNSWVNFGAHLRNEDGSLPKKGDKNYIPLSERDFADQKNFLFPDEYVFDRPNTEGRFTARLQKRTPSLSTKKEFVASLESAIAGDGDFAHMTAENPFNKQMGAAENKKRNKELQKELEERGYQPVAIDGFYDRPENSFYVRGIPLSEAMEIGEKYGQESVAHSEGMAYTTGKHAGTLEKSTGELDTGKLDNYYSEITTGDGSIKYNIGYDWGNYTKAEPRLQKTSPASSVDLFTNPDILNPVRMKNGRTKVIELARAFDRRAKELGYHIPLNRAKSYTDAQIDQIAEAMADDAELQLKQDDSGIGWYDLKTSSAMELMSRLHPELSDNNGEAHFRFTLMVAIISQNNTVDINFRQANEAYTYYKENGSLPKREYAGTSGKLIAKKIALAWKNISDIGFDSFKELIKEEKTRKEWESQGYKIADENMETKLTGAMVIFGSKIGSFWGNLNGDFSTLTADLWFSRMFNRYTGNTVAPDRTAGSEKTIMDLVKSYRGTSLLFGHSKEEILKGGKVFDSWLNDIVKDYADSGYKLKNSLNVPANTHLKNLQGLVQDAPRGGNERNAMRGAVQKVQDKLIERGYPKLDIADIQAIVWYNEKDLYRTYKAVNKSSEKTDYETAAQKVLRTNGINDEVSLQFQRGQSGANDDGGRTISTQSQKSDKNNEESESAVAKFQSPASNGFSIYDAINDARSKGFKDAAIDMYLSKQINPDTGKPFTKTEIKTAMAIPIDIERSMPPAFGNVEGGAAQGQKMFTEVMLKLKRSAARMSPITTAKIRAKAQATLREHPDFDKQSVMMQNKLIVALDGTLGTTANKVIQKELQAIKKILRGAKMSEKIMRSVKVRLRTLIRKNLPEAKYSKADVNKLIKLVTDATPDNIQQVVVDITAQVTAKKVGVVQAAIEKILKTKLKKTDKTTKRSKGTAVPVSFADAFNEIKESLTEIESLVGDEEAFNSKMDVLIKKHAELITQTDPLTDNDMNRLAALDFAIGYANTFADKDTDGSKFDALEEAHRKLKDFMAEGRSEFKEILKAAHEGYVKREFELFEDLTGIDLTGLSVEQRKAKGRALKTSAEQRLDNYKESTRAFIRVFEAIGGWVITKNDDLPNLIDQISKGVGKMFGGVAQDMITYRLFENDLVLKKGKEEMKVLLHSKMEEIFGANWEKISTVKNSAPINTGVFDSDGKQLKMSQNEMYYWYNQAKDPANDGAFEAMFGSAYKSKLKALEKKLDPKVKEWADWQVDEYFPQLYDRYNEVYKRVFRTNMPWNQFYAGKIHRDGVDTNDVDMLSGNMQSRMSVAGGSSKNRTKNNISIKRMNGDIALGRYVNEMERFRAFQESAIEIGKMFQSDMVRHAIVESHGEPFYNFLINTITEVVNGGRNNQTQQDNVLDMTTKVFIFSKLAANLTLFPKQMTSAIAYGNSIGYRSWTKELTKSLSDPLEWRRTAKEIRDNSIYIRDREGDDFMSVIDVVSKDSSMFSQGSATGHYAKKAAHAIVKVGMAVTKKGDISAIMLGGIPIYNFHKAEFAKKNPKATEQEAIDYAVKKFEIATDGAQQSGWIGRRDSFQKAGSFVKTTNLFLTSVKQYWRKSISGYRQLYRNLKDGSGKGSIRDNIRTIATYRLALPMFFTWATQAFPPLWDLSDDEEDELIAAAVFGNVAALFMIGNIATGVRNLLLNKPWASNMPLPPLFSIASELIMDAEKIASAKTEEKKQEAQNVFWLHAAGAVVPLKQLDNSFGNWFRTITGAQDFSFRKMFGYGDWTVDHIGKDPEQEAAIEKLAKEQEKLNKKNDSGNSSRPSRPKRPSQPKRPARPSR